MGAGYQVEDFTLADETGTAQSAFAATHSLGYPPLTDTAHPVAKELGAYRRPRRRERTGGRRRAMDAANFASTPS